MAWAKWPLVAEVAEKEGFPEEALWVRVLGNGQGKERRQAGALTCVNNSGALEVRLRRCMKYWRWRRWSRRRWCIRRRTRRMRRWLRGWLFGREEGTHT